MLNDVDWSTMSRDQIVAAQEIVKLEGDDQILAQRVLARGTDPFALEYVLMGVVSDSIRGAHERGPGHLKGAEKTHWLFLAAFSVDEAKRSSLVDRMSHFAHSLVEVNRILFDVAAGNREEYEAMARSKEKEIKSLSWYYKALPDMNHRVGERVIDVQVYQGDLGFAAAYWSGQEYAAVLEEDGKLFLGSQDRKLSEIGLRVDVEISPQFGFLNPTCCKAHIESLV